jgi:hypothetical protein
MFDPVTLKGRRLREPPCACSSSALELAHTFDA